MSIERLKEEVKTAELHKLGVALTLEEGKAILEYTDLQWRHITNLEGWNKEMYDNHTAEFEKLNATIKRLRGSDK